jgi:hypothetical protein
MMTVKINIAYSMCCFQNGMKSERMDNMTLTDLEDIYSWMRNDM